MATSRIDLGPIPTLGDCATYDESLFPELWQDCYFAIAPCLGYPGMKIQNYSRAGIISDAWGYADWGWFQTSTVSDGLPAERPYTAIYNVIAYTLKRNYFIKDHTISGWMRYTPGGLPGNWSKLIAVWDYNFGVYVYLLQTGAAYVTGIGYTPVGYIKTDGLWHHYAFSEMGSRSYGWIDGVKVLDVARTTSSSGRTTTGVPGDAGVTYLFPLGTVGAADWPQVDDVRLYLRGITDSEARLLASGRGVSYFRKRPRRFYSLPPSFLSAWARNRAAHIIGGGLR